jgi:hypothetical protein
MKAWNRYLQKLVTDYVAAWATTHNIPPERWRGGPIGTRIDSLSGETSSKPQTISQRAELYNFFDSLPIEDLLQLRVPLDWVLKVTRVK